jgi:hypothetical protein
VAVIKLNLIRPNYNIVLLPRTSKAWYARDNFLEIKLSESLLNVNKASIITILSTEVNNDLARLVGTTITIKKLLDILMSNCNTLS